MTTARDACTPARVHVRIIGPTAIVVGDETSIGRAIGATKTRQLLELLLIHLGRAVPKDQLIEALWGDARSMPADPSRTLEHYVCVLRAALTPDRQLARRALVTTSSSYHLDSAHLEVDLDEFTSLLRQAGATADAASRRAMLASAVALGDGELFADSTRPDAVSSLRVTHRESVSWAHQLLAADALTTGDLHRVVWHGEQALRFTPCAELAFCQLMVAHVGLGDPSLARLTHRRCVAVLDTQLGLAPTAQTTALAAAVDHGDSFDDLLGRLTATAA